MNTENLLLNTDSYKLSHYLQYPPNTEFVNSYIESRGTSDTGWNKVVFFGLQYALLRYLSQPFTSKDIEEADMFAKLHGVPFNKTGWERVLEKYRGFLPLYIEAVPEGTVLPASNVLVQVRNTDPEFPWLTSYFETLLLRAVWYPTTVATQSFQIKKLISSYLEKTGDPSLIGFKLHDFGFRGVSSFESAGIGGMAHLTSFLGTDTMAGALFAHRYYDAELPVGFSIPAAEHSTITSWSGPEQEVSAHRNMLKQFGKPGALVASVSDSWDIYSCARNIWGTELKQEVLDSGATVVVRPDSGVPERVVPEILEILMERFGYTTNNKGYRVLHPSVRVIQGDGINYHSIDAILYAMWAQNMSADNVAFGMGGALLQGVNRDTLQFAMKCSAIYRDGEWHDVFKRPATDAAKNSKAGLLALVNGKTYKACNLQGPQVNQLQPVYVNGRISGNQKFEGIRNIIDAEIRTKT